MFRRASLFCLGFLGACVTKQASELSAESTNVDKISEVYSEDVLSVVANYIAEETKNGIFTFKDPQTATLLRLELVEVTDPVRVLPSGDFLACAEFHAFSEDQDKLYDIDFRIVRDKNNLYVKNIKVHKQPEFKNGVWSKVARYRFIDEKDQMR